ncbi:uncharacterized protein F5147DRAFT_766905 [Suillus discolor]|uniref:Fungal-type protein kinase domain-containing protein n=1 Tax=Suillus discolor TaxID=1912936 RepID=A0A9P7K1J1_9AGAM|nr:uncharacterized protein F5147DRAFT_766905 [Suillus discolor]KAG2121041.1 hypothetical protein F5147DRAFT_766905 [Suillus discolor]
MADKSLGVTVLPQQSRVRHGVSVDPIFAFSTQAKNAQVASFLNNELELATHHCLAKVLKKESHQNFSRNIHICHWKQLCEPLVHWESWVSEFPKQFPYTEEGWIYSSSPFIPPMVGKDLTGPEYEQEEPFANFFTEFTKTCATVAGVQNIDNSRVWHAHHNTFIDKRRKPDLVKYKDTLELVEDAYEQLYDNVFFIFSKQDNWLFFIGFTMCGANLCVYMFHYGGTMESMPMSLHTDPGIVTQALVAIAHGSLESIGYDPTVTTPQFSASMGLCVIQMKLVWLEMIQPLTLTIDTCLFSSHSVQGQGTHVFACIHPMYSQYLVSKEANVNTEGKGKKAKKAVASYEAQNKDLHECNGEKNAEYQEPPEIAVYLASQLDVVTAPRTSDPHNQTDKNSQYFKDELLPSIAACGIALPWFATIEELLNAILMAVQGHGNALGHDILHRDVSLPNVMIAVNSIDAESAIPGQGRAMCPGFLANWGLAIDLRKENKNFDES